MTIFYAYLNWYSDSNPGTAGHHRQLLVCESRDLANEFFRALQDSKNNGRKRFKILRRSTPQMWNYDSDEGWDVVISILRNPAFAHFARRIMSVLLPYAGGGADWPVIPIVEGPDWVSGKTYFIRNKRQPELYWYYSGGYIEVSRIQKSKFRIDEEGAIGGVEGGEPIALIGSDIVEVSMAGQTGKRSLYLGTEPGSNRLVVGDGGLWSFSSFMDGRFGSVVQGDQEFVTWEEDGNGDEWEFC